MKIVYGETGHQADDVAIDETMILLKDVTNCPYCTNTLIDNADTKVCLICKKAFKIDVK